MRQLSEQHPGPAPPPWLVPMLLGRGGVGRLSSCRASGGGGGATVAALDDLTDVNAPGPDTNDVLTWSGTEWVNAPPGGGAAALDDLSDVDAAAPDTDDVLTWDGDAWVNAPPPDGGVAALDDVGDVDAASPGNGDILTWDTDKWIAAPPVGAGGAVVRHQARFAMFSPPAGGSFYPLFEASVACEVKKVRVIHSGSGAVSVNVKKNHRAADTDILSSDLVSAATWQNDAAAGGGVALAAGDELDVELAGVAGYVEHIVVQVDYEETL